LRIELANAQRRGEYQRAGELAYGRIPELEKRLAEIEAKENSGEMMEEAVTANHIAQVVSRWTGVPVDKMLEGEKDKLLRMETARQARGRPGRGGACGGDRGAARARRPAGSQPPDGLVHVPGPTGVGKTELTKALAESVRRRDRDGAHRHVRIHGEAFGGAADRRASGLCRL
jgi:ATP-dependent Clp protease ATP-binding subunit ClpB